MKKGANIFSLGNGRIEGEKERRKIKCNTKNGSRKESKKVKRKKEKKIMYSSLHNWLFMHILKKVYIISQLNV